MTGNKEERAENTGISHTARVTKIPSGLLCRGPQQLLPLKKSPQTPCRFYRFSPHRYLQTRCQLTAWVPPYTLLCCILESTPACSGLCSRVSTRHQPRPLRLIPTAIHTLGASPSNRALARHFPDSSHQPPLWHALCESLQPQKCTWTARVPTPALGSALTLSPIKGLHYCACAWGETLQPQKYMPMTRAPIAPAAGPGPCCWPWTPLLCVCLQQPLPYRAGTCSQVFAHHQPWLPFCLPWSLATEPGSAVRTPTAFRATVVPLQHVPRTTQLSVLWTSVAWTSLLPGPEPPHTLALGAQHHKTHSTLQHVPTCWQRSFPRDQSIKSGRGR